MLVENQFRITQLEDVILPERNRKPLLLQSATLQNHFLFSGDAGLGKSLVSVLLPKYLGLKTTDSYHVNVTDAEERSVNTGFEKLKNFINSGSTKDNMKKYLIIDEADIMHSKYMDMIKNFYDKYKDFFVFIFTTNNVTKFKAPILDRMVHLDFNPREEEKSALGIACRKRIRHILTQSGIPNELLTTKDIDDYIRLYFPHYRSMFNMLNMVIEYYKKHKVLKLNVLEQTNYLDSADKIAGFIHKCDWDGFSEYYANNPSYRPIDVVERIVNIIANDKTLYDEVTRKNALCLSSMYINNMASGVKVNIHLRAFVAELISSRRGI